MKARVAQARRLASYVNDPRTTKTLLQMAEEARPISEGSKPTINPKANRRRALAGRGAPALNGLLMRAAVGSMLVGHEHRTVTLVRMAAMDLKVRSKAIRALRNSTFLG